MQVAFLSEGATELGVPAGARDGEPWGRAFAIQILIERILGVAGRIEPWTPPKRRGGAGPILKRMYAYLRQAAREGAQAAVVLVDADTKGQRRLNRLELRRRKLVAKNVALGLRTAIGVAVEKLEAWLLADEMALCRVLGLPNPPEPMKRPEELKGMRGGADDAKTVLGEYLAKDQRGPRSFLEHARAIVAEMDLDEVARKCPKGFEPFRQDVQEKLGPLCTGARR